MNNNNKILFRFFKNLNLTKFNQETSYLWHIMNFEYKQSGTGKKFQTVYNLILYTSMHNNASRALHIYFRN